MTTVKSGPQTIETRIGTLEFTHDFANGFPTDATVHKLYDERDFQRACQAYLWALPAVSFTAWQRGINGLGARNGQIVAILSYEARRGILTANATTPYYLGFADLSAGPLIMILPAEGVQGAISDAWQSLSSRMTSFLVTRAGIAPSAAAYPLLKQSAASVSFHFASARSNARCDDCVPLISRDAPAPTPNS